MIVDTHVCNATYLHQELVYSCTPILDGEANSWYTKNWCTTCTPGGDPWYLSWCYAVSKSKIAASVWFAVVQSTSCTNSCWLPHRPSCLRVSQGEIIFHSRHIYRCSVTHSKLWRQTYATLARLLFQTSSIEYIVYKKPRSLLLPDVVFTLDALLRLMTAVRCLYYPCVYLPSADSWFTCVSPYTAKQVGSHKSFYHAGTCCMLCYNQWLLVGVPKGLRLNRDRWLGGQQTYIQDLVYNLFSQTRLEFILELHCVYKPLIRNMPTVVECSMQAVMICNRCGNEIEPALVLFLQVSVVWN